MKNKLFLSLLVIVASMFTLAMSCEEDPTEFCEEEEICDGKDVASCCTEDGDDITCVYKYNGKEYSEDEIAKLADALGCSSAGLASYQGDNDRVIEALQALMDRARSAISQE